MTSQHDDLKRPWWALTPSQLKDLLLFLGGLCVIGYETLIGKIERPYLLAVAAAMLGLPYWVKRDRGSSDSSTGTPKPPTG